MCLTPSTHSNRNMRRSSSSNLLTPRYSNSSSSLIGLEAEHQQKVNANSQRITMVTTTRLPSYSIERYYMLSEIEEHAHSIIYLDENRDQSNDSDTESTMDSSSSVIDDTECMEVPAHVIIYMLWRPTVNINEEQDGLGDSFHLGDNNNSSSSPLDFLDVIEKTVLRVQALASRNRCSKNRGINDNVANINSASGYKLRSDLKENSGKDGLGIHVVIDKLSPTVSKQVQKEGDAMSSSGTNSENLDEESLHSREKRCVEELGRLVAKSQTLRPLVQGLTIGFTSQVRAAPAMETILTSVTYGARDRRRLGASRKEGINSNLLKSSVGVIAMKQDDLIGMDQETETDAVQGIIQSITRAEWNASGDHESFAMRAHEAWKKLNGVDVGNDGHAGECVSTTMVTVFLIGVFAYVSNVYGEAVLDLIKSFVAR